MPYYEDLNWNGLSFDRESYDKLMAIEREEALAEVESQKQFFAQFEKSGNLPEEMRYEQRLLIKRLERAPALWKIPRK